MLALVMAAWVRLSALVFAFTYSGLTPNADILNLSWFGSEGVIAIAYLAVIGFMLVGIIFAVSAFAVPRILDRDTDFISAMGYSFKTVSRNLPAMAVWAAIIVSLTAIGIATAFIGLTVIFPVLGFATWHSYKTVSEFRTPIRLLRQAGLGKPVFDSERGSPLAGDLPLRLRPGLFRPQLALVDSPCGGLADRRTKLPAPASTSHRASSGRRF